MKAHTRNFLKDNEFVEGLKQRGRKAIGHLQYFVQALCVTALQNAFFSSVTGQEESGWGSGICGDVNASFVLNFRVVDGHTISDPGI